MNLFRKYGKNKFNTREFDDGLLFCEDEDIESEKDYWYQTLVDSGYINATEFGLSQISFKGIQAVEQYKPLREEEIKLHKAKVLMAEAKKFIGISGDLQTDYFFWKYNRALGKEFGKYSEIGSDNRDNDLRYLIEKLEAYIKKAVISEAEPVVENYKHNELPSKVEVDKAKKSIPNDSIMDKNKIESPKIFISYAWVSDEYQKRVEELAERLTDAGVEVIFDKWALLVGNDKYVFMEKCVNDKTIHFVLILLDKVYEEKADGRMGGVGTETQIISPEVYNGSPEQTKFVPIVFQRDENGGVRIPSYLKSRMYFDLSNDSAGVEFKNLVRHLYGTVIRKAPPKGSKPAWVDEPDVIKHGKPKPTETADERYYKAEISEQAKAFIIDNDEERNYLPLCVMAASVHGNKKHNRAIFTHFNKCSSEIQKEILRQENIQLSVMENNKWVSEYLDKFEENIKKYKLGLSYLYDCAKYFHRGFDRYRSEKIENDNPHIFEIPIMSDLVKRTTPDFKATIGLYIDRYLEYVLRDRPDSADKPEILPQIPPFDLVWSTQNLGGCDEKNVCFWVMILIKYSCIAFFRHNLIQDGDEEWRQISIGDAQIETFEDLYYDTLLALYTCL